MRSVRPSRKSTVDPGASIVMMPPLSMIVVPLPVIVPPNQSVGPSIKTVAVPPRVPEPLRVSALMREVRAVSAISRTPPVMAREARLSMLATLWVPSERMTVGEPSSSMQTISSDCGSPFGAQFSGSSQEVPSPPPSQARSGANRQSASEPLAGGRLSIAAANAASASPSRARVLSKSPPPRSGRSFVPKSNA